MESYGHNSEDLRENLEKNPTLQRMINMISLAKNGAYVLSVSTTEEADEILKIIKEKVPQMTDQPIDIQKYTTGAIPGRTGVQKGDPLDQWIYDIQKKKEGDEKQNRLFVIDGSATQEKDRLSLINHFAFLNGKNNLVVGNPRGPVMIIVPKDLKIEPDIGIYGDLLTRCQIFFIDPEE